MPPTREAPAALTVMPLAVQFSTRVKPFASEAIAPSVILPDAPTSPPIMTEPFGTVIVTFFTEQFLTAL